MLFGSTSLKTTSNSICCSLSFQSSRIFLQGWGAIFPSTCSWRPWLLPAAREISFGLELSDIELGSAACTHKVARVVDPSKSGKNLGRHASPPAETQRIGYDFKGRTLFDIKRRGSREGCCCINRLSKQSKSTAGGKFTSLQLPWLTPPRTCEPLQPQLQALAPSATPASLASGA
jgi:hypothetical protein